MTKYILNWLNLGKVNDLYPILRKQTVAVSNRMFPKLKEPGVYMFLDDQKGVIDVGEANPKGGALRNRIRNEIYENSAFSRKLVDFGMNRAAQLYLTIKVANVEEGIDYSILLLEEIDRHLRLIERALICVTDPWAGSHGGLKKWKKEEIEIVNHGDFSPLSPTYLVRKGKCLKKWDRI